ncbi:MAG: RNHCP domain-containing protein [Dehalococcoidales bacterium]|nr:MAG: RNHCP domain-containing protein [Dehalococcoidales bacterium]
MSRAKENAEFICENCGREVLPLSNGSYRNHCPFCLFSKHVDVVPGDRLNECSGLMRPMGLRYKSGKGFQITHRCLRCGEERVNRLTENSIQPDDIEEIIKLFGI